MLFAVQEGQENHFKEPEEIMAKKDQKQEIQDLINTLFDANLDPSRRMLERVWFRNILYALGEQWLEWVGTIGGSFKKKYRNNKNMPTPVDNIVRDYVRTMRALILNKDFAVRIWPNTQEREDIDAAKVGEKFLAHLDLEDDEAFSDEIELATDMMIICGTSFLRVFPDTNIGGWALDKSGLLIPNKGEVGCGFVMPFNVFMDELGGQRLERKRYVGIKSLKPKEWVEDIFKVKVSGGKDDSTAINYEQTLMKMVSDVAPWKGAGFESSTFELRDDEICTFYEVEFEPTKDHPQGQYAVATKDGVIKVYDKLPIPAEGDSWYYTLTDFHYNRVPGRYWSDGGVTDIISPQNSINNIDQATEMNRRGIGRPMIMIPQDVKLKRIDNTGQQSIMVLSYDSWLSGGAKPEVLRGTPLPDMVLKERDIHRTSAQDMSGDPKNVLRGNVPSSQASGVMVDILRSAAEASHGPDIGRFYRSKKRVYKKRLVLGKELYTEERMIKISGKGTDIEVMKFKGADLRNNTDVRLELASGVSTTAYGKTQVLMKLVEGGWFGDLATDPETRQELLTRIGLSGFKDKISVDVERAEWENTVLASADEDTIELVASNNVQTPVMPGIHLVAVDKSDPENPKPSVLEFDPMFMFDNHRVHFDTHRRFILTAEFRDLMPAAQGISIQHAQNHQIMMQQEEQLMQQLEEEQEGQEAGGKAAGTQTTSAQAGM